MNVDFTLVEKANIEDFLETCEKFNCWLPEHYETLHYSYSFQYTSLGIVVSVKCKELGVEKDITDYQGW